MQRLPRWMEVRAGENHLKTLHFYLRFLSPRIFILLPSSPFTPLMDILKKLNATVPDEPYHHKPHMPL